MAEEEERQPETKQFQYQELFDGEQFVASIVDSIVDSSYEILNEHCVRQQLPAFAASMALKDVFDVVRTGYLDRDQGDSNAHIALEWIAEEEPQSLELDSWARGRVKVMSKPKEEHTPR